MARKIIFRFGRHIMNDFNVVAERHNELVDEVNLLKQELLELKAKLGIETKLRL